VWNDSEAYEAVSKQPLFSHVLWSGPRAPLVPLFLKLTGGYDGYGIAQAVVSTLAWGFLAWTVARLVAPGWRRVLVILAVLGFATAPLVVQWDWSALSESPSLSALACLLAVGLWLVQRFTWIRLLGLGVAAAAYVGLRDADIWVIGAVGLVLVIAGVTGTIRGAALQGGGIARSLRRTVQMRWFRTRRPIMAGAVLFVVALAAGVAANASHRNVLNIEEVFYVRIFPYPDRVAWFASHGMPMATDVETFAQRNPPPAPGNAPVVSPGLTDPMWHPLKTWFEHHGLTAYTAYLVTHPGYVIAAPFERPQLTFNNASGDLGFYIPTGHLTLRTLQTLFVPDKVVVIVMAGCAVLLAAARRLYRRREWIFITAFALVGLASMLLAWHGEGQEVTRHMVEGDVEVRLGVLLALLLGLLADRQPDGAGDSDVRSHQDEPREPLFV